MELERPLACPLPEDYRVFLLKAPPVISQDELINHFIPLHFYAPDSLYASHSLVSVLDNFLREWHPLRGSLMPVEYLGEGLFACIHLCNPCHSRPPIVLWDITADLLEQSLPRLAPGWPEYVQRRIAGFDPAKHAAGERRERKRIAQAEIMKAVNSFNQFSQWFHQNYQQGNQGKAFEHDQFNQLPRFDSWRPERFCVHDNLLGVMGYRVNRNADFLEVAGFATKDHTNYARGSGMQALLLSLLCEWARQSCKKGIVFVDEWHNAAPSSLLPVPYDIVLYGYLLGADLKPGIRELNFETCRKLFLRLTPFGPASQKFLEHSGLSVKACLMAHKGVWSVPQIEDLVYFCPLAKELFEGMIAPEEQIRMVMLLEHTRMCVMAGMAEQMIRVQAEEKEKAFAILESSSGDTLPYSRGLRCESDLHLTCLTEDGREIIIIPENTSFLMAVWPANRLDLEMNLGSFLKKIHTWSRQNASDYAQLFLLVPEESSLGLNALPFRQENMPIRLALLSESYEAINTAAFQRIQQARRMRS